MNTFEYLNSQAVPMEDRLKHARAVFDVEQDGTESHCSAKCWLTYRMIDGIVPFEDWTWLNEYPAACPVDPGLQFRWQMSQLVAEVYLHGLRDDTIRMHNRCQDLFREANGRLSLWPPAVLNFLRAKAVFAAFRLLLGNHASADSEAAHAQTTWAESVSSWDFGKHPLRVVEMRDDMQVLWDLAAIRRSARGPDFPSYEWLPSRTNSQHPYYRLMRQLKAPQLK